MESVNLNKFPAYLKEGFQKYNLDFFDGTEWEYDPILVYRMVLREEGSHSKVTRDDFISSAVMPRRGMKRHVEKPDFYGTSFFVSKDNLVNKLKLPRPGKKIASGHIKDCYGPIYRNLPHICLWIYKDADFSDNDFMVDDYE